MSLHTQISGIIRIISLVVTLGKDYCKCLFLIIHRWFFTQDYSPQHHEMETNFFGLFSIICGFSFIWTLDVKVMSSEIHMRFVDIWGWHRGVSTLLFPISRKSHGFLYPQFSPLWPAGFVLVCHLHDGGIHHCEIHLMLSLLV